MRSEIEELKSLLQSEALAASSCAASCSDFEAEVASLRLQLLSATEEAHTVSSAARSQLAIEAAAAGSQLAAVCSQLSEEATVARCEAVAAQVEAASMNERLTAESAAAHALLQGERESAAEINRLRSQLNSAHLGAGMESTVPAEIDTADSARLQLASEIEVAHSQIATEALSFQRERDTLQASHAAEVAQLRKDVEAHAAVAHDALDFVRELQSQIARNQWQQGDDQAAVDSTAHDAAQEAEKLRSELAVARSALEADRDDLGEELRAAGAAEEQLMRELHGLSSLSATLSSSLGTMQS